MSQESNGDHDDDVRWSQVEDAFFVGSHRGNFVGYIDQTSDGTFWKFDEMSQPRGAARTLERSMTCLNDLYFATAPAGDDR